MKVEDGGFFFFKNVYKILVYSSYKDVYICILRNVQVNCFMGLIFFRFWRPYPMVVREAFFYLGVFFDEKNATKKNA